MLWNAILGIAHESLVLLLRMSPYLLFGFFVAGIIHVFVSLEKIARHLGKSSVMSVIKAVILGIPLPLCSCGVIPAAILLKKKGASRGAVVSFLIATPITGVDSIFATYSLMGLFFTIYRIIASAVTAFVAGIISNLMVRKCDEHGHVEPIPEDTEHCPHCGEHAGSQGEEAVTERHPIKIVELFRYAFIELMGDVWRWLVLGILIGGIISYMIPAELIERYLGSDFLSMMMMLIIGIPMYVCATGSLPIAAALMMKGMSPGAALVFLLAGPATNAVTITVITRELGKRTAIIYVFSIAVMSVVSGMLLNAFWRKGGGMARMIEHGAVMLPYWVEISSSIVLAALCLYLATRNFFIPKCGSHSTK